MSVSFPGWLAGSACTASEYHAKAGEECQDAAGSANAPRPFAAVFDGRGSSDHSQHGSRAAGAATARIIDALEPLLSRALDQSDTDESLWTTAGQILLRLLREEQRRVARENNIPVDALEFTVSLAILGVHRIGVIQLGDSATLIARADGTVQLAAPRQQGEAAGETVFLSDSDASIAVADFLVLPAADLVAVFCFSDGVADGWLDSTNSAPAPGVSTIVGRLRKGEWTEANVMQHLNQPIWRKMPDDDRGVAYCVQLVVPNAADANNSKVGDVSGA